MAVRYISPQAQHIVWRPSGDVTETSSVNLCVPLADEYAQLSTT